MTGQTARCDWRLAIDNCRLTTGRSGLASFLVPHTLMSVSGCFQGMVRWKQIGLSGRHLRMWGVGWVERPADQKCDHKVDGRKGRSLLDRMAAVSGDSSDRVGQGQGQVRSDQITNRHVSVRPGCGVALLCADPPDPLPTVLLPHRGRNGWDGRGRPPMSGLGGY